MRKIMKNPIYFVHISDSHIGPSTDFESGGRNPYGNLTRLLEAIKALPTRPDFVMHTGDVASGRHATLGDPEAYQLASEQFAQLGLPMYYAVGNHDDPSEVLKMKMGERSSVIEAAEPIVSYSFEFGTERFAVLHSQGPHEEVGAGGKLPEGQLEFLEQQLADGTTTTVFLHHCPMDIDSAWFKGRVDMVDGMDLHRMLLPYRESIRGVFFGHIHRAAQIVRDGIHYCSVGSPYSGLNYWPDETETDVDPDSPLPYNFITLTDEATIIKEHCLPQ